MHATEIFQETNILKTKIFLNNFIIIIMFRKD